MRHLLLPASLLPCLALLLASGPAAGQSGKEDEIPYKIHFDPATDVTMLDRDGGKEGLFIRIRFTVELKAGQTASFDSSKYKIAIEEDGKFVKEIDVPKPKPSEDVSVVMAVDTGGSMRDKRMEQVRSASDTFLNNLPKKAEVGLILFNHEICQPIITPTVDRKPVVQAIRGTTPRGGTRYLDGAARGIAMLKDIRSAKPHDKALVLMTDGIDLGSKASVDDIIRQAKGQVRIYAIGIGEPGKLEPVNSVLVLDHSGSMKLPADNLDKSPKIAGLHRAGERFIGMIPYTARTTLVPFSSSVDTPKPFSNDKFRLIKDIQDLQAKGETALFDAVYTAICTIQADNPRGKKAVVAMTDGIDNISRRRVEEVIERAKEAKIPLYLLGFGRDGELDAKTMKQMADQTGGRYFPAPNEKALVDIFENLSIELHDDGIDEATLQRIAKATDGKYFPAKDVASLQLILKQVQQDLQKEFHEETFPSRLQNRDGRLRRVDLKLVYSGQVVTQIAAAYQTHGVVIAEMNHLVFLALLAGLGVLIALPAWLRRSAPAPV